MISLLKKIGFFLLMPIVALPAHADHALRKVVDSSVFVPGTDSRFVSFTSGALVGDGTLVFTGQDCKEWTFRLTPCDIHGIYRVRSGVLETVHDNADAAPGTGAMFESFGSLEAAELRLAFLAALDSGGFGLFVRDENGTSLMTTFTDVFDPLPSAHFKSIGDFDLGEDQLAMVATAAPPPLIERSLYQLLPDFELLLEGETPGFRPRLLSIVEDRIFLLGSSADLHARDSSTGEVTQPLRRGDPVPGSQETFFTIDLPVGDSAGVFLLAGVSPDSVPQHGPVQGIFELVDGAVHTVVRSDEPAPGGGSFPRFTVILGASGRWVLDAGDPDTPGVVYIGSENTVERIVGEGDLLDGGRVTGFRSLDFDGDRLLLLVFFESGDEALYLATRQSPLAVPVLDRAGIFILCCLLGMAGLMALR